MYSMSGQCWTNPSCKYFHLDNTYPEWAHPNSVTARTNCALCNIRCQGPYRLNHACPCRWAGVRRARTHKATRCCLWSTASAAANVSHRATYTASAADFCLAATAPPTIACMISCIGLDTGSNFWGRLPMDLQMQNTEGFVLLRSQRLRIEVTVWWQCRHRASEASYHLNRHGQDNTKNISCHEVRQAR